MEAMVGPGWRGLVAQTLHSRSASTTTRLCPADLLSRPPNQLYIVSVYRDQGRAHQWDSLPASLFLTLWEVLLSEQAVPVPVHRQPLLVLLPIPVEAIHIQQQIRHIQEQDEPIQPLYSHPAVEAMPVGCSASTQSPVCRHRSRRSARPAWRGRLCCTECDGRWQTQPLQRSQR